ncbi:hypothetical protein HOY82DRAFT_484591 [Tuber indicum]|nr:hypothetical protein HOY82DRAFT_484591 [Tuber indicum]
MQPGAVPAKTAYHNLLGNNTSPIPVPHIPLQTATTPSPHSPAKKRSWGNPIRNPPASNTDIRYHSYVSIHPSIPTINQSRTNQRSPSLLHGENLNFCARAPRLCMAHNSVPVLAPFYRDATFPNDWPLSTECKLMNDPGEAGYPGYPRVGVHTTHTYVL